MSSAGDSSLLPRVTPHRWDGADDEWRPEMAWTVPKYAKKRVNWAGKMLVADMPEFIFDPLDGDTSENLEYNAWAQDYYAALDIVNNWRSSHNFPLNTFHIGLKKRAKQIDPKAITAQRIKRLASIESKLTRFSTMTLSQMQDIGGCRAIVSTAQQVSRLCEAYDDSGLKHLPAQRDNYIDEPKQSGYRGVHLIYKYHSDRKQDYNSLKVELQLRSHLQHAWATAVETVGAFVKQALKSSVGEQEWLRFFSLMGGAFAFKENTAPVPGVPNVYSDLVKELRDHARSLEVVSRLQAFGAALKYYEGTSKNNHYFLLEVNHATRLLNVTGFKRDESEKATAKYLEVEKKIKGQSSSDAVLVSVDSMNSLRQAYPNYFLDSGVFLSALQSILAPPRVIAKGRIRP
ncbi:RelA/SpoT domain-containing protein [Bradyrhizobium sp. 188]|uniref:RelA/SpoT domain-containing protein n=1 Tax=Bradyrhizobium sp. 188 TaxID=2782656 RepID=UPI001FF71711|nr:RelA/SpoT domain-containing protein [Bradyrhizobium sp. 188]MCK1498003.1 RelA/SpoT domain-containing protein [Bradyrhizobium sp. 188]